MIPALVNHLWQSTLFLLGAGLLSLGLRRSGAGIRFGVWLAASVKFLIPFAVLMAVGEAASARLHLFATPPTLAPVIRTLPLSVLGDAAMFAVRPPIALPGGRPPFDLASVVLVVWGLGVAVVLLVWAAHWRRVRTALKAASPVDWPAPALVMSSPLLLEPGVVGLRRPVLLLPEGIVERLSSAELEAVIAHELCHIRRRDNLTAAVHMLVQALFWFHPLVWWLGGRLIEERERACDEGVIRAGHERETYARGILETCRLYLQSQLICVSGVSGSDLKRRVEIIMTAPLASPLPLAAKALVGAVAVVALASPVAAGAIAAAKALQTQASTGVGSAPLANDARLRAEQERPRQVAPFYPARFDRYVGYYELAPNAVFQITRIGDRFYSQLTGQAPVEIFPESDSKFFATVVPAQISFDVDAHGRATGLVLHQNGGESPGPRIDEAKARSLAEVIEQRIASNTPSPGTADFLKRFLDSEEAGSPDLSGLTPGLAANVRAEKDSFAATLKAWGALGSIQFSGVMPQGFDRYIVTFANAQVPVVIGPLDPGGKVSSLQFTQPLPTPAMNAALAQRVKTNRPSPGTEASVRRWLSSTEADRPDFDDMTARLAEIARQQWPRVRQQFEAFGPLKDMRFVRVSPEGRDVYEADFRNNRIEVAIGPLTPDGKVDRLGYQVLP